VYSLLIPNPEAVILTNICDCS